LTTFSQSKAIFIIDADNKSYKREFSRIALRRGAGCVSKRGVDDGNQKGVSSLQPAQEGHVHYIKIISFFKKNFKKIFEKNPSVCRKIYSIC